MAFRYDITRLTLGTRVTYQEDGLFSKPIVGILESVDLNDDTTLDFGYITIDKKIYPIRVGSVLKPANQ
ncbi:hypothetical protein A3K63_00315 [Candidatus Micrarchaeota archaeon RBG_16_49_10]|nr:MAG: hypothetical protein A3K63_00315 [Candidatus Micrarchaeota archaeon RBG_16_49_10]